MYTPQMTGSVQKMHFFDFRPINVVKYRNYPYYRTTGRRKLVDHSKEPQDPIYRGSFKTCVLLREPEVTQNCFFVILGPFQGVK